MIANEGGREVVENGGKGSATDKAVVIDDTMLLILRKNRRALFHRTCLLSVMAAFTIGLAMGVFFLPLVRFTSSQDSAKVITPLPSAASVKLHKYSFNSGGGKSQYNGKQRPAAYASVSFISDDESAKTPPAAALEEDNLAVQPQNKSHERENNETLRRVVDDGIYWGRAIEERIPGGFGRRDTQDWRGYLQDNATEIVRIEQGCGRMQNRLVTFSDGVKACVRYRQNTDQIQGELFSFFLGRLLNISNLVPSTAAVIDWESRLWTHAKQHITESQWKTSRPVVFTKFIADLVPSDIPEQFRPLERHLNRHDLWNMTLSGGTDALKPSHLLIERLTAAKQDREAEKRRIWREKRITLSERLLERFVELAQWSDLIVFDYLIANLDRVVNNLYNYQWNADIMAAPAHNLARQRDSQLLVFLDNESGLLHGYRLLKKYEAYHSLLLDELCVFRRSTVDALRHLRDNSAGELLNAIFEEITSERVRDVLPPLPEKSIKILSERIDRVLQQVQKCQDMYANR